MNPECPRCKVELKLLDPKYSNGVIFLCPECLARFSCFNGLIYEVEPAKKFNGLIYEVEPAKKRRIGCISAFVIVVMLYIVVVRILVFYGRNNYNAKMFRLQQIEKKFGVQSVEYCKARLDILRNYLLKENKRVLDKHLIFLKKMNTSGYSIHSPQYMNNKLTSLIVRNVFDGREGNMNAMSDCEFNYPNWMPYEQAHQVWRHFSCYDNGVCESRQYELEKEITDIEEQL